MSQVCLQDYDNRTKVYQIAVGTDFALSSLRACKDTSVRPQGFCSVRRLGLLCRVKDLIAVFADGESLRLGVQGRVYDLSEDAVIARREKLFPGVRRFLLMRGERVLVSYVYWNRPGRSPEGGDIFEYAERVTQTAEDKTGFLEILNAWHSGKDLNDMEVVVGLLSHRKTRKPGDGGPVAERDE